MRGSDFYGIQNLLLHRAGLPSLGAFPYSVQHGWQHAASSFEAAGDPIEIWVWSERSRLEMGSFFPLDRIRVIGSPYLYLDASKCTETEPRRPSLFVLPHSSHFARIGFEHRDLENLLDQIRMTDGGCDVLAYYLDVNDALCMTLRSSHSRILLNGGLWSSKFLSNFRNNVRMYERVYFSNFGSAVLFAQHEGLDTQYVNLSNYMAESSNVFVDHLSQTSDYDPTGSGLDTREELGVGRTLSALEMRDLCVRGFRRISLSTKVRRVATYHRNSLRDYFSNVRPSFERAARHNAALGW